METFLHALMRVPGVAMIPFGWRFQTVYSREVALRLVEVTLQPPQGELADFGGPEVPDFKSIAESWLKATGRKRRLIKLPMPMKFSRDSASGKLLAQ